MCTNTLFFSLRVLYKITHIYRFKQNIVLLNTINSYIAALLITYTELYMESGSNRGNYSLQNFGEGNGDQNVQFTSKDAEGNFVNGTTNEEVIDMLIERYYSLNKISFSAENQCAILLLKNVRVLQKKRLSRKIDNVIRYNEKTNG